MAHRSIPFLLLSHLLFLEMAEAATIRVPSDQPTILAGLDAAAAGDTVLVAPGTYGGLETRDTGTACGFLKADVVLKSETGSSSTIMDVNSEHVEYGANYLVGYPIDSGNMSIEGFTFRGAEPGVMGIFVGRKDSFANPSLTIRDCRFEDFVGADWGYAVILLQVETTIEDCSFLRCREGSSSYGGVAVLTLEGLQLDRCYFVECSSAVVLDGGWGQNSLLVRDCVFLRNSSLGNGAAIATHAAWTSQIIENCSFIGNNASNGGALSIVGLGTREIRNCVFANNQSTAIGGAGGALEADRKVDIIGCTFWENSQINSSLGGAALFGLVFRLERNIFARNFGSEVIRAEYLQPSGGCNDYWDNPQGNIEGYDLYPTDIFVDPLFCDPENEDWHLTKGSPCLPEGSGACGLIGAFGVGCGTVSVERSSWGRIKELYR
jgi:hypothetical protein